MVSISDAIEWWVLAIAIIAAAAWFAINGAHSLPFNKKAGTNLMSIRDKFIKPASAAPAEKTQTLSEKLGAVATSRRNNAGLASDESTRYAEMSAASAEKSARFNVEADAIERAKAILDEAGVTL